MTASDRIVIMLRAIAGVAFVTCSFPSIVAAGDGIDAWPNLRWGLTEKEVQRTHPEFQKLSQQFRNPNTGKLETTVVLGLRSYVALGCEFQVSLQFLGSSLEGIVLTFVGNERDKCRDRVTHALASEYGRASASTPLGFTLLQWHQRNVSIGYIETSNGGFNINYRRWPRLSEQIFRIDKWSVCRG